MTDPRTVAILIFDEVEVLDFAGPFEVFSVAGEVMEHKPFHVVTVARDREAISARGGLQVLPHHGFADCPEPDILLVPGGYGTRALMEDEVTLDWIRTGAARAELLLSVCTGSLLLGRAGLLEGLEATTHHSAFDRLEAFVPTERIHRGQRVVDNGETLCSAGVAAGIDMSFHVLTRLLGADTAERTARYMEYPWQGSAAALGQ